MFFVFVYVCLCTQPPLMLGLFSPFGDRAQCFREYRCTDIESMFPIILFVCLRINATTSGGGQSL